MLGFLAGIGGASILVWGAKGSKDASLPINKGPSKPADVGPRGLNLQEKYWHYYDSRTSVIIATRARAFSKAPQLRA
eukprot:scaffold62491_cov39-Prasinocladus_malaysianus.AAC.1